MAAVFPPERVSPTRERKNSGFALVLLRYRLYCVAVQLYRSALQYSTYCCCVIGFNLNAVVCIHDLATASFIGAAQAISCVSEELTIPMMPLYPIHIPPKERETRGN